MTLEDFLFFVLPVLALVALYLFDRWYQRRAFRAPKLIRVYAPFAHLDNQELAQVIRQIECGVAVNQ